MKHSIQFRLGLWLSLAVVCTAIVAGVFSFLSALDDARELQDDILRQAATVLARQADPINPKHRILRQQDDDEDDDDDEDEDEHHLLVQTLPQAGEAAIAGGLALPAALKDGLHTVRIQNSNYRVMVKTMHNGQRVALSQSIAIRDEIAHDSAWRTVLPLLVLVPLLLLMVVALIRHMLRPVSRLAQDMDARNEHDLHAMPAADLPSEIRPFVTAINRLLGRVDAAMQQQRRFVADAAHELRSPLTALSLQAERLGATPLTDEAQARLLTLQQGIARNRHLLDQLLNLARAQQASHAEPMQTVAVRALYRRVLEDLLPLAQEKGLDVGLADGDEMHVQAHEMDLFTLVRNLVDNAIRYTPAGGKVDLSARQEGA
ncbi:MAG: histidine kinase dimerization/phospho-acceptor domain-containing protein, partial [Brachymonas sp.]|nr:histidine kinase dimerization/phospho-acceptor domain-containing protein [Brachymonas sp.]